MQTIIHPTINDDMVITTLAENGYVVIDHYLSTSVVTALANIAKTRFSNQEMTRAGVGKNAQAYDSIRGDSIYWLDENSADDAVQYYFSKVHSLRALLNQQLFMGLTSIETHLAVYTVGATYQKHLDQFSLTQANQLNTRKISTILYLNENWLPEHGGELRLYISETESVDILPLGGRLVLFLSANFWHEVLPANRERLSLTGWFRTRELQPL
ncbi:MAG: 2OG-Fe(II) oxygenase [Methylophilus sp.]|nr:2OG-Fe(II) oxygenase [Methylophilus sp.]